MLGGSRKAAGKTENRTKRLAVDSLEDRIMLSVTAETWYDVLVNTSYAVYQSTDTNGSALATNHDGDMVATWTRGDYVLIADPTGQSQYYLDGYYIDARGNRLVRDQYETEAEYLIRLNNSATAYYLVDYNTTIDVRLIDINTGAYIDPETGELMIDYNIYARYLTDEVQRITLPMETVENEDGSSKSGSGTLSLTLGGTCQQKITFSAASATPYGYTYGYDGNLDIESVVFSYGGQSTTFHFNESAGAEVNARELQIALQNLGPNTGSPMANATVTAISPTEFLVEFGQPGDVQDLIQATITSYSSLTDVGFLPAVDIQMVRNAVQINNIPIHTSDWALTAKYIKEKIELIRQNYATGPLFMPTAAQADLGFGPATEPDVIRSSIPEVTVVPVYGVTNAAGEEVMAFDITFVGSSGKQDQPLIIVTELRDPQREDLLGSADVTVRTIKESSPEFQVNDWEGYDPYTGLPRFQSQYAPSVAMDADGEFVITWTSENSPTTSPNNPSDIYARRYQPQSWQNPAGKSEDFIQSVKPLGDAFRVNSFTANTQYHSDVAMDDDGNFVIVWSQAGQNVSYFNGIHAQMYDSDGNTIGDNFRVDLEETGEAVYPTVAMNNDGYFAIAWVWVGNADAALNQYHRLGIEEQLAALYGGGVYYSLFDPEGTTLVERDYGMGGWMPSLGFSSGYETDENGQTVYKTYYGMTVSVTQDNDNHVGANLVSNGVYTQMYSLDHILLDTGDGAATVAIIIDESRVNSGSLDPNADTLWAGYQDGGKIAIDADGDFIVAYYGYGADINENVPTLVQMQEYLAREINATKNADLQQYLVQNLYIGYSGDVDSFLNSILAYAQYMGANLDELGRLYAAMNNVYTTLRGEANGAMFTMYDALPIYSEFGGTTILSSDNVANATRDGENAQYNLYFPHEPGVVWTIMNMRVYTPWGWQDISFVPVYEMNNGNYIMNADGTYVLNVQDTADALEAALLAAVPTGENWNYGNPNIYDGPVEVRVLTDLEVLIRQETEWRLYDEALGVQPYDIIFEIQFQGDVHDSAITSLYSRNGSQLIAEEQQIVITHRDGEGGFLGIRIGDASTGQALVIEITEAMLDDPLHPGWENLAGIIAGLINNLGYPGVVVEYEYVNGEHQYNVSFPQQIGQDIPPIEFHWEFNDGRGGADQPAAYPEYRYVRPGMEITKGRTQTNVPYDIEWFVYGDAGREQAYSHISMQPDGDFSMIWTQYERYTNFLNANTNIYSRMFDESTDTAGPKVTGISTLDGVTISDGKQVSSDLLANNSLIVTFDEEMLDYDNVTKDKSASELARLWAASVNNPANWALMYEGVEISGAILDVTFGNNESMLYTDTVGTNKWEAVISLNPDVINADALANGLYTIVAKSNMTDVAGNPLGRSGFEPNGSSWERDVIILTPDGDESLVNDPDMTAEPDDGSVPANGHFVPVQANNNNNWTPTAVAATDEGDTVTVWTAWYVNDAGDTLKDAQGNIVYDIYARVDYMKWDNVNGERVANEQGSTVIRVTDEIEKYNAWQAGQTTTYVCTTVEFASVAVSGAGIDIYTDGGDTVGTADIVVTWSQNDGTASRSDWNVYARIYAFNGQAKSDAFLVNDETGNTQRYSSVAMAANGDFVVTWQSNGNKEDTSGYGIFAKRYNSLGQSVGGASEVQTLNFTGTMEGSFTLKLYDGVSATPLETRPISFDGSTYAIVDDLEAALNEMIAQEEARNPGSPLAGLRFTVEASSTGQIVIYFTGEKAKTDMPQLEIDTSGLTFGAKGSTVYVDTMVEGVAAEFLVNETTANSQLYAAIDMDYSGNFVISWTSYGQDGDTGFESNIYGRYFYSNEIVYGSLLELGVVNYNSNDPDGITRHVVGSLPADNYVTVAETGVGYISVDGVMYGTGSLLTSGTHVLTAAHVVTYENTNIPYENIAANFTTATGEQITLAVTEVIVHPGWQWGLDYDVAILVLAEAAPRSISRYDIYRASDEVGKTFYFYGYGMTGDGINGYYDYNDQNDKLTGMNRFDGTAADVGWNGTTLIADFDSGNAADDTLGILLGVNDLGFGNDEITTAPGDSGGPAFVDGASGDLIIAAICRGAISTSITAGLDGTFGEVFDFTRISLVSDWIDSIVQVAQGTGEFLVNDGVTDDIQKWSDVAMDADGDFVITWTSAAQAGYQNHQGNEIYARRYASGGAAVADPFLVNTVTADNQQLSKVAMDANGDFIIVWESFQDRTLADGSIGGEPNSWGVYAQRYLANGSYAVATNSTGKLGGEFQINTTLEGDQRFPGVAMSANGDIFVVWQGYGDEASQGIFARAYYQITDDTSPIVAATYIRYLSTDPVTQVSEERFAQVRSGDQVEGQILQYLYVFDEQMMGQNDSERGSNSVLSPSNWVLYCDGKIIYNAVESITRYNPALDNVTDGYPSSVSTVIDEEYPTGVSQKNAFWITLNMDVLKDVPSGSYTLILRDRVEDIFGNPLDSDLDGAAGGGNHELVVDVSNPQADGNTDPTDPTTDHGEELVNTTTDGNQSEPAMAMDAQGNYVVVWTSETYRTTTIDDDSGEIVMELAGSVIRGQLYNSDGTKKGNEFIVSSSEGTIHKDPSVAMSANGTFVVSWTSTGVDSNQNGVIDDVELRNENIFVRVFHSNGTPFSDSINTLRDPVNTDAGGLHQLSSVAMDQYGTSFVVAWANSDSVTIGVEDRNGVWYQRYTINIETITRDGANRLVNTPDIYVQTAPAVACDAAGNFTIVWQGHSGSGTNLDIFAKQYNKDHSVAKNTFQVNTDYATNIQQTPSISMNVQGDFVVAWASYLKDGSQFSVVHRVYDSAGNALTSEIQTNTTVQYSQYAPSAALNRFVDDTSPHYMTYYISWTSYRQEQRDYNSEGVYGRLYNNYNTATNTWTASVEESINIYQRWNENQSCAAVGPYGNRRVVWVGPDFDTMSAGVVVNGTPYTDIYQTVDRMVTNSSTNSYSSVAYKSISAQAPTGVSTGGSALVIGGTSGVSATTTTQTFTADADKLNAFVFTFTDGKPAITFNGEVIASGAGIVNYVFNASDLGSGVATAVINGLGVETVEVRGSDVIISGSGFKLTLRNCTDIQFDGLGTAVANIYTSGEGDEVTVSGKNASIRLADGRTVVLRGCGLMNLTGTAADTLNLLATTDTDTLNINHTATVSTGVQYTTTKLTGSGYSVTATSFGLQNIQGYNNNDTAVLKNNSNKAVLDIVGDSLVYTFAGGTINLSEFKTVNIETTGVNAVTATITTSDFDEIKTEGQTVTVTNTARNYSQKVTGLQNVSLVSGGNDSVILVGTSSADTLTAGPVEATFVGANFSYSLKGFDDILAIGGSNDTANLYDSAGNDTFTAGADSAILSGTYIDEETGEERTYRVEVQGFGSVAAHSTGGNDTALLYDSAGDDVYTAYADYAVMAGTGFANTAYGFAAVKAFSEAGSDTASFIGSAGNDEFILKPNSGKMIVTNVSGDLKSSSAEGFANITVDGKGGEDSVSAYDSAGDDEFILAPGSLTVKGDNFRYSAANVEIISAVRTEGGNDTLEVSGNSGLADTVILRPRSLTMLSGDVYVTTATGFSNVSVNAGNDRKDTVLLYDSRGDDTLTIQLNESVAGHPTVATMEGEDYFNKVSGFRNIKAYATAGGNDTAVIHDSLYGDNYDYVNGILTVATPNLAASSSLVNFDEITILNGNTGAANTRTDAAKTAENVVWSEWE